MSTAPNVAAPQPAQNPAPAPAPIQQFVPMILNAQPVPPPPVIAGKPVLLAIAVPATPVVDWRWSFQFSQLRAQFPSALIMADNKYGIAQSREALLNQFNALPQLTHMLFLDTDIIPPDYGVYTLLSDMATNPDIDIISGMYWNSLFTGNAAWNNEVPLNLNQINAQSTGGNPIIKVDKCGFGFTLLTKELMKKLLTEDRPLMYYKITGGELHSEDFYFAAILKRLKIPMYVDVRIECQHVKTVMFNARGGVSI